MARIRRMNQLLNAILMVGKWERKCKCNLKRESPYSVQWEEKKKALEMRSSGESKWKGWLVAVVLINWTPHSGRTWKVVGPTKAVPLHMDGPVWQPSLSTIFPKVKFHHPFIHSLSFFSPDQIIFFSTKHRPVLQWFDFRKGLGCLESFLKTVFNSPKENPVF